MVLFALRPELRRAQDIWKRKVIKAVNGKFRIFYVVWLTVSSRNGQIVEGRKRVFLFFLTGSPISTCNLNSESLVSLFYVQLPMFIFTLFCV